jgi:hypothetical protein
MVFFIRLQGNYSPNMNFKSLKYNSVLLARDKGKVTRFQTVKKRLLPLFH